MLRNCVTFLQFVEGKLYALARKEWRNNEAQGLRSKGQGVRGDQAEENIVKHLVALLRSAMPVYHELKMIKQNTKTQAEAYLLERKW